MTSERVGAKNSQEPSGSSFGKAAGALGSHDGLNEAPQFSLEEFQALLRDAQKEVEDDFMRQFVIPMRNYYENPYQTSK